MDATLVFDRASWDQKIHASDLRCLPPWDCLTSPAHLLQREAFVDFVGKRNEASRSNVDVFVFGKGEPELPFATKIGGVPFRSREKSWPSCQSGHPLTFIAQFYFAGSSVIQSNPDVSLRGDVLLLFGGDKAANQWHTEWSNVDERDLMMPEDVPNTGWRFEPCYGLQFQTLEFVWPGHRQWGVIAGTKIGGLPWTMPDQQPPMGEFIASVGSLKPAIETPFPWCNRASPLTLEEGLFEECFCYGDVNVLNIMRMRSGEMRVVASSTMTHFPP